MTEPDLVEWMLVATRAAGVPDSTVSLDARTVEILLDVARDAAHHVVRPAAPIATFALGLAIANNSPQAIEDIAGQISVAALAWPGNTQ